MKLSRVLGMALFVLTAVCAASGQWQPVTALPGGFGGAGAMALLTDGRVLVHDESGSPGTWQNWWTLTPSSLGDYATGTWTQVASLPSNYGPLYFSSAVLPDGRYIIEGGEYNNGVAAWTKLGAIYDPVVNIWTAVAPPPGWASIGDAPSVVLNNGTYMQSSCCDTQKQAALLNAGTLVWTAVGAGKFDVYDEEGMTLLPGGEVLDVDAYVFQYNSAGMNFETYNPGSGTWTSQGSTQVQLWDSAANCGGSGAATYDLGPAVLLPNGTVLQTGANSCAAGHNALYNVGGQTWTKLIDFPTGLDVADGPAALEVNGNVLVMTSPGVFNPGAVFFEFTGIKFLPIGGPPNSPMDSSFYGHMLMLPTGQILFTDFSNAVELFTSAGPQYTGWTPTALVPSTLTPGSTITLDGSQFNGASQNNAYGDDFQDATNYPLVRFTSTIAPFNVYYAKTHNHSTMAVGYLGPTYTFVDIPATIPAGTYNLQVVVNGIASVNYPVTL
jgi:hypothetical protein